MQDGQAARAGHEYARNPEENREGQQRLEPIGAPNREIIAEE
jgi:hypothetical protein